MAKPEEETFESRIYEWRNGKVIRTLDIVTVSYFTEDGGYVPQRILSTKVSELKPTDDDWAEGIEFANTIMAEDYLAQFD